MRLQPDKLVDIARLLPLVRVWLCLLLLHQVSKHPSPSVHAGATGTLHPSPATEVPAGKHKRGLVAIYDTKSYTAADLNLLSAPDGHLTWYYSYWYAPTPNLQSSTLEFVPMLSGPPGTGFSQHIVSQQEQGQNISYILFLNEPDGCEGGGSCLSPSAASEIWAQEIAPIKSQYPSILVSAPAVTGSPRGLLWLQNYFAACDGRCPHDFLALHWYGQASGLEAWVGQMRSAFLANSTAGEIWVTEYGLPFANLSQTEICYNDSTAFLDAQPDVSRYAYFGSFRSTDSNIGPDAAMLDGDGHLTDIGNLYLGMPPTGNVPDVAAKGVLDAHIILMLVTVFCTTSYLMHCV